MPIFTCAQKLMKSQFNLAHGNRDVNKKLCYCRGTARRATLVNLRYTFHEVRELERFQTAT